MSDDPHHDEHSDAQVEALREQQADVAVKVDSMKVLAAASCYTSLAGQAIATSCALIQNGGNPSIAIKAALAAVDSARALLLKEIPEGAVAS